MVEFVVLTTREYNKTRLAAVQKTPQAPGSRQTRPEDQIKVRRVFTHQLESDAIDNQAMAKHVEQMLGEMQAGH